MYGNALSSCCCSGPAFVLFTGFVLLPIVVAVYYGFYKWSGFGPLNHPVGLGNYRRAFSDTVFLHAIQHNVTIAVLSLIVQLPLSIGAGAAAESPAARPRLPPLGRVRSLRPFRSRHCGDLADAPAAWRIH